MIPIKLQERPGVLFAIVFLGFLALSYAVGIGPALLSQDLSRAGASLAPRLDEAQERGRAVYVAEGCAYCHTQQVRPIPMDAIWGRPTTPIDYAGLGPLSWYSGTPGMLGSERTGPDLSNVGARQSSEDWHLIHLYDPRLVVPDSIMPAMPWLFRIGGKPAVGESWVQLPSGRGKPARKVIATTEARDLVRYLLQLNTEGTLSKVAPQSLSGGAPRPNDEGLGAKLYQENCASCHQSNGEGLPGVFPPLAGSATVQADDPSAHILAIVFGLQGVEIGGVAYAAAMPAFGARFSDAEIAALVNYERSSWGNSGKATSPAKVHALRKEKNDE